jgi:hypothetical protein
MVCELFGLDFQRRAAPAGYLQDKRLNRSLLSVAFEKLARNPPRNDACAARLTRV